MPDLTIYLDPKEKSALDELARLTLRDPRAQAKIILVNELIRQGVLVPEWERTKGEQCNR